MVGSGNLPTRRLWACTGLASWAPRPASTLVALWHSWEVPVVVAVPLAVGWGTPWVRWAAAWGWLLPPPALLWTRWRDSAIWSRRPFSLGPAPQGMQPPSGAVAALASDRAPLPVRRTPQAMAAAVPWAAPCTRPRLLPLQRRTTLAPARTAATVVLVVPVAVVEAASGVALPLGGVMGVPPTLAPQRRRALPCGAAQTCGWGPTPGPCPGSLVPGPARALVAWAYSEAGRRSPPRGLRAWCPLGTTPRATSLGAPPCTMPVAPPAPPLALGLCSGPMGQALGCWQAGQGGPWEPHPAASC